jgi:hypothetical protein
VTESVGLDSLGEVAGPHVPAAPNHALEPTAYSLRSYVAAASGGGSPRAFGVQSHTTNWPANMVEAEDVNIVWG